MYAKVHSLIQDSGLLRRQLLIVHGIARVNFK